MKYLLLLCFLFSLNSQASNFKWNLQITYPDFELKNIPLSVATYKPKLPKTGWRCWFGETEINGKIESKNIRCNFSSKATGQFKTVVSCSSDRPYGETKLELLDERKNLTYNVLVFCQK